MNATSGDEDCLFLNVFAPANATKLPVLMLIRKFGLEKVFDAVLILTPPTR